MIIALYSPKPQSGKTTVARYLQECHGFRRVPFAGTLKAMMRPMLMDIGYDLVEIERLENGDKTQVIPGTERTLRHLYQTLGTEWGRNAVDPNLWVNVWQQKVALMERTFRNIVVDDMRFPNELDVVLALGGEAWAIDRTSAQAVEGHASEGALNSYLFPVILENNGSLEDLYAGVDAAILGAAA
jgi:hypothetical protein